jgi:ATP-dependent Clp protease ATP-binding subunit ClpA
VIVVMTSNAGAQDLAKGSIGINDKPSIHQSMDAIKKIFAPEFINRLDAIVHFQHLDEEIVLKIVAKFIDELKMQLQKKNVDLTVTPEAQRWLMKKGYDKIYGARPLARTIDEHIKKALVDDLLFGRLANGGRVTIGVKSGALDIKI